MRHLHDVMIRYLSRVMVPHAWCFHRVVDILFIRFLLLFRLVLRIRDFLNDMRYINSRFTYLLTYLLTVVLVLCKSVCVVADSAAEGGPVGTGRTRDSCSRRRPAQNRRPDLRRSDANGCVAERRQGIGWSATGLQAFCCHTNAHTRTHTPDELHLIYECMLFFNCPLASDTLDKRKKIFFR